MKDRLHTGLQLQRHHCLRDSVRYGRHPEDSRPATMRFRYLHRTHRRRKIRPRRHPIPDPVQIIVPVLIELINGLSIHSRRALIRFDTTVRLPYKALRNVERLDRRRTRLAHSPPPTRTPLILWLFEYIKSRNEPDPSLHPHYKGFITTTTRSASKTRNGTQRLRFLPV